LRIGRLKVGDKTQKAGLASKPALRKLNDAVGRKSFTLEVRNNA